MRQGLKVHEIAPKLATPTFSEAQAANLFRKLAREEVFQPVGRIGDGKTSHFVYDPLAPAAAAVVFAIWDANLTDRDLLAKIYSGLTERNTEGNSWIAHALACAANYPADAALPALVISILYDEESGELQRRVDMLDSLHDQVDVYEDQVLISVRVNLNKLLRRFVVPESEGD